MKTRNYTFIVASDQRSKTFKFVLSSGWVKGFAFAFAFLTFVGMAAVVDYFGLLVQSIENKRLKAENVQLQSQFEVVETKLATVESNLERIKTFSTKLKMITDPNNSEKPLRLAMGPMAGAGQSVNELNVSMEDRSPSMEWSEDDKVFWEKPPLEENEGEIAKEGNRQYASLSIRVDKAIAESQLREQNITELWEMASRRQIFLMSTPSIQPVRGWFTSRFGYRINPYTGVPLMHSGLDIAASPGTPVHATADGIISFAGYDSSYGKLVTVDHGNGVKTRFGHLSQIYVTLGQKIHRGDVISAVGNTGHSTGPHLHYEVHVNNVPVDPANYILEQ